MILPKFRKINVQPYRPGKSRLFKIKNIVKLSANESALGVSPKVKREINKKINFYKYPDNNSNNLDWPFQKNLNVNLKKLFVELAQMKLSKLFANNFKTKR